MVPDLARLARLSPFHFIRRFRAETGCTPHRYLTLLRMRHAKALLAGEPDTAIREVGYRSGYDEPAAFARAFRRSVGMAPQEYRRRRMAEAVLALAASAS
jgi:AraC family transcriptional regulator